MKKTALITGASSGIGYEYSKIFASHGYDLVLVARNEEKLKAVKAELEGQHDISAFVIAKDLSQKDAAQEIFEQTEHEGIEVNVLVNDAGFGDYGRYADADWKKQYDMVQVNVLALMQLTKLFLPQMLQRKEGKILNMASIAAFSTGPYMSVYYASKSFVLSFSDSLATELKGSGVTVTAVCPGPTDTGFEKVAGSGTRKLFDTTKRATPDKVALFAYRAMMRGTIIAIPGLKYKVTAVGQRFLPKSIVRAIALKLQSED
ncbi:MAG: SDR family oxidoreductase [Methanosarcinales archaeon]|jgi:short-subunit dehydrogenase|nr:SDR family oxidoreductase [Methanosarcinales archaeon]